MWRRFVAAMIDSAIVAVLTSVASYILVTGNPALTVERTASLVGALTFLINWFYFALFESSSRQATPDKMALGIFVTDTRGDPISAFKATVRHFVRLLSGFLLGIGFLMAAFSAKRQALHDIIPGSLERKHR